MRQNTTLALLIIVEGVVAWFLLLGIESLGKFLGLAHVQVLQLVALFLILVDSCVLEGKDLVVTIEESRCVVSNFDACKILGSILDCSCCFGLGGGQLLFQLSDLGNVLLPFLLAY
ncbi:hypothetical protein HG530_015675 [Fusarium avenaceum]|nr:hypothetical protein HG530_015675 [Fusarium avenaceum]